MRSYTNQIDVNSYGSWEKLLVGGVTWLRIAIFDICGENTAGPTEPGSYLQQILCSIYVNIVCSNTSVIKHMSMSFI